MLMINCPYCGPRDESEFSYGGEAHIARPLDPGSMTDEEWGEYLFFRTNPKGVHRERWVHSAGCRRWFNAVRNTVTYKFEGTYKIGESGPSNLDQGGES